MKKAVLIQPPVEDFYLTAVRTYPLNLCYLASVLEQEGIETEIIDMLAPKKSILPIPHIFSYLKKVYLPWDKSPYSLFKHYQRFGYSNGQVAETIKNIKGDLFLIPSNFTAYFNQTVELAVMIKKYHPNAITVTGGYHASADPENTLKTGVFDHIVTGEGEYGLKQIIHGNTLPVIHSLPDPEFQDRVPSRHLLEPNRYTISGKKSTCITVGRGCPMKCEFCTIHSVYNHSFRKRSITAVLEEIKNCWTHFGIRHFDFEDDNLGGDTFSQLLNGILEMGLTDCTFSAMNGLPYHTLSGDVIRKMKKAGFTHLDISFATYSSVMNRQTDMEKFEQVVHDARSSLLPVNTYFILGLPGLSFQDNLRIIDFLNQFKVTIGPSIFYTVPGIPFYSESMDTRLCRSSAIHQLKESTINRDETVALFRYCRALNFLKKEPKTDFEAHIAETTRKTGMIHVRKHKRHYQFLPVEHSCNFSFLHQM